MLQSCDALVSRHTSKRGSVKPTTYENVLVTRCQPPRIGDWKTFIRYTPGVRQIDAAGMQLLLVSTLLSRLHAFDR